MCKKINMNKNPTVSVIIPTYNRAHLGGRAIQSVLTQTYQDFESNLDKYSFIYK